MVGGVALLAVIPDQALRRAKALPGFVVALLRLVVANALLAFAPVHGIPPVPQFAAVALRPGRFVLAAQTRAVLALRVAVALARGALREVPAVRRAGVRRQRVHVKGGP